MGKHLATVFFAFLCIALGSMAQDIHFSQYFNAPLTVSPSNTGNFDGDWRLSSNYRSQWRRIDKPYLTQSFGFDRQVFIQNEQLSAGLFVINDKSGGTLNVFKIFGSGAYHKRFGSHNFHLGLQGGYVGKSIDPNQETFPNQFNWGTGQFDKSLPHNESNLGTNMGYFDLNTGFGYNYTGKKIKPYINFGIFHVNRPNESFFSNADQLELRQFINGGVFIRTSEKVAIEPSFIHMSTVRASGGVIGSNVHYILDQNEVTYTSVYGGIFYRDGFERNPDAYFLTGGIRYKRYTVGLSYDRNISELHTATDYRGAFEIAFIYTGLNTRPKKLEIPCDRY